MSNNLIPHCLYDPPTHNHLKPEWVCTQLTELGLLLFDNMNRQTFVPGKYFGLLLLRLFLCTMNDICIGRSGPLSISGGHAHYTEVYVKVSGNSKSITTTVNTIETVFSRVK